MFEVAVHWFNVDNLTPEQMKSNREALADGAGPRCLARAAVDRLGSLAEDILEELPEEMRVRTAEFYNNGAMNIYFGPVGRHSVGALLVRPTNPERNFYFFGNDGVGYDANSESVDNAQWLGVGVGPDLDDARDDFLAEGYEGVFRDVWAIEVTGQPVYGISVPDKNE